MMQFKIQKLSKPGSNDPFSCRVNLLVGEVGLQRELLA